jgi:chorismate-pyruvate lyase
MPALDHLASLFYRDTGELGSFVEVLADSMPSPYRELLAHHEHMTVSVERRHGCKVDVQVLQTLRDGDFYSRKIVLHLQEGGKTVLFGVPRINLRLMGEDVRREILSEQIPLGRVLIDHNVMREVQLASLYRVMPGPAETYGRTAFIYCDGYPAIELLEIVSPEPAE